MGLCNQCKYGVLKEGYFFCFKKEAATRIKTVCHLFISSKELTQTPRVFIGSSKSTEAVRIADCVHIALEELGLNPSVWTDNIFEPTKTNIENLVGFLDTYKASVFVFHPEDTIIINESSKFTVRDNVLFELGLFIGRLGREKVFIFHPSSNFKAIRIATDLFGVTLVLYDDKRLKKNDPNWLQVLAPKIRSHIGLKLLNL
ncbi:MAG: nucleotide-binding protein [Nitrosopumilus sp.]